jgi:hypothetical protein
MTEFETELRDLLESLRRLSLDVMVTDRQRGETIQSLGAQLEVACAVPMNLGAVRDVSVAIKCHVEYLAKADMLFENLERVRNLIFMFQEMKHQNEIRGRTSKRTVP